MASAAPPDLEARFQEPEEWRYHTLQRGERTMRYGTALPSGGPPKAIVFILPGLSEFCEKHYETASDLLAKGYGVCVIDWIGQGKSSRYLDNPHKRHSLSFAEDVSDLSALIGKFPGDTPKLMLAHSMGGNIGMRYIQGHPTAFAAAAFSAPMFGIRALSGWRAPLAGPLTSAFFKIAPEAYALGNSDFSPDVRDNPRFDVFSSDSARKTLHNDWSLANPDLQVGGVTNGWVYHAYQSCRHVMDPGRLKSVRIPCLIAQAGKEVFVDNRSINKAISLLPNVSSLTFKDARHEILMERDEFRDRFLQQFEMLANS